MYYCWITLLIEDYEKDILSGMIKKGYIISAGVKGDYITQTPVGKIGSLFCIKIAKKNKEETSAQLISTDLLKVINNCNAKYYSIIVYEVSETHYCLSNIILPEDPIPSNPISE